MTKTKKWVEALYLTLLGYYFIKGVILIIKDKKDTYTGDPLSEIREPLLDLLKKMLVKQKSPTLLKVYTLLWHRAILGYHNQVYPYGEETDDYLPF
jgi:hypothetical protein